MKTTQNTYQTSEKSPGQKTVEISVIQILLAGLLALFGLRSKYRDEYDVERAYRIRATIAAVEREQEIRTHNKDIMSEYSGVTRSWREQMRAGAHDIKYSPHTGGTLSTLRPWPRNTRIIGGEHLNLAGNGGPGFGIDMGHISRPP